MSGELTGHLAAECDRALTKRVKLLDTAIAVDHLRGRAAATTPIESVIRQDGALATSELTRFELPAGMGPGEDTDLEAFFAVLDWVPVTEAITRRAGQYARAFRRSHCGIGHVDHVIAASADLLSADLQTLNLRHFPMFPGLAAPYACA